MRILWLGRLLLVPWLVAGVVVESDVAEALLALGALLAVVSIEAAYRAALRSLELQIAKWHRRWDQEHKAFQEWIATEHRRRAAGDD